MSILFVSDLHLDPAYPQLIQKFLDFIYQRAPQASALYLLGDVFEVWLGDDAHTTCHLPLKQALKNLSESGVPVYFMHGNRDFLIGQQFIAETGCQLIADPTTIFYANKKIVLAHGDTLCLDDTSYLRFRTINRWRLIQRCFLALPLRYRQRIARKIRTISRDKDTQLQDITVSEIPRLLSHYQADIFIHGHTHRPSIHYLQLDKNPQLHVVLSDWHDHGNAFELSDEGVARLFYF